MTTDDHRHGCQPALRVSRPIGLHLLETLSRAKIQRSAGCGIDFSEHGGRGKLGYSRLVFGGSRAGISTPTCQPGPQMTATDGRRGRLNDAVNMASAFRSFAAVFRLLQPASDHGRRNDGRGLTRYWVERLSCSI